MKPATMTMMITITMTKKAKRTAMKKAKDGFVAPSCAQIYGSCSSRKAPMVKFLKEHLEKAGCGFGEKFINAVHCDKEISGGYTRGEGIMVCSNHMNLQDEVNQVIIHELIHAYANCRASNLDWANCAHHACSEVSTIMPAYSSSHQQISVTVVMEFVCWNEEAVSRCTLFSSQPATLVASVRAVFTHFTCLLDQPATLAASVRAVFTHFTCLLDQVSKYTTDGLERARDNLTKAAAPFPMKQIFDTQGQNAEYIVKVTFLELHNEEITDLLAPKEIPRVPVEDRQKKQLPLMEDGKSLSYWHIPLELALHSLARFVAYKSSLSGNK
ncbi:hypothetical protein RHGRI_004669 [Rhododendron griersonianum]|uniref:Mitochondrial inner membrane protease ATP23 n=1 Tax=Rhododendron griersonianum TaxID=479676 RepID=A0AAV6LAP8_9ERIC|nr:hypothetical protein RHGRI_004669 [Rhododendron griersonianum]